MKTRLVGVHKVTAKLASGSSVTYYYAWRGGPRIKAKPGTPAFVQEFARLTRSRPGPTKDQTIGWLLDQYISSADFQKLRPNTRHDYQRIIGVIRVAFGTMPTAGVEEQGARGLFLRWRDSMRATPRSADMHLVLLARVLSWAKNRELIRHHPLERTGRLHGGGNRKDLIWMPGQLATMLTKASPQLVKVAKTALWTMQRQGDILTMPTLAYDGGRLWITQGKTGARVRVRPAEELVPLLEEAKAQGRQRVHVNTYGQNWTSSGFQSSWGKEMARLKIDGVRFHDLRGTGISYAYANGMDVEQIAEISGHSKAECEGIIRRHYLAGGEVIEAIRAGTQRQ